jgi:CspA family cold shock protein
MESNKDNNTSGNVLDNKVYEGVVIFFRPRQGYGFIGYEVDGMKKSDMFIHYSDIAVEGFKTLYKGQKVSFSIGLNRKGEPKAINVKVIS